MIVSSPWRDKASLSSSAIVIIKVGGRRKKLRGKFRGRIEFRVSWSFLVLYSWERDQRSADKLMTHR